MTTAKRPPKAASRIKWALAGVVDESERLGGRLPIPPSALYVPTAIEIVPSPGSGNSWLRYRWSPRPKFVEPGPRLLDDFVELGSADDAQIADYARKWGVFGGVCEHGVPSSHPYPSPTGECEPIGVTPGDRNSEPLDFWRSSALRARALLNIASRLAQEETVPADSDDWVKVVSRDAALREWNDPKKFSRWLLGRKPDLAHQRGILASFISAWLATANVVPRITWNTEQPSLQLGTNGRLYGAIGLQLASAISRADGLATCSACGKAFLSERRSGGRRRRYCVNCGTRGRWRLASARHRKVIKQQDMATRKESR